MSTEEPRLIARERLRELRWTQADLARASGVDPNTVSDFLNGRRRPSSVTLAKIGAALGATLDTSTAGGEGQPPRPQRADELTNEELLAELGYRLTSAQRRIAELEGVDADEDDPDIALSQRSDMTLQARHKRGGGHKV